jgi:hypothetical protein
MMFVVCADDGDRIAVAVDDIETEQSVLRLELQNAAYGELSDLESITLPLQKARELADALTGMADAIERFHRDRQSTSIAAGAIGSIDRPSWADRSHLVLADIGPC